MEKNILSMKGRNNLSKSILVCWQSSDNEQNTFPPYLLLTAKILLSVDQTLYLATPTQNNCLHSLMSIRNAFVTLLSNLH